MRWSEPRKKVGREPSVASALLDRELPLILSTARAIEYATPTHSARTTTVYSVSFPVWAEWSHWSNKSTNGQVKQIKTSPAASVDRNRMYESILPPANSRHRNCGSEALNSTGTLVPVLPQRLRNGLFSQAV